MKKILYIIITFGVIGGGFFGGVLSDMVSEGTYNVLAFSYLAVIIIGYVKLFGKKKKGSSSNQAAAQKSAPAARPAAQTARPVQTTQKSAPKTAPTANASSKSGEGLIFADFFAAIPGALKGLLVGFVFFFIFGLIASLTSAHSITNTFGKIAVLCLFGCTIVGYIKSLKQQPKIRKKKELLKSRIETLSKALATAFHKLNNAKCSTEQGLNDYGDACDFLVYAIPNNYFAKDQKLRALAHEYNKLCHQRTYPYYAWNSRTMKYEYVVGTELAEELMKAIRKYEEENKDFLYKM